MATIPEKYKKYDLLPECKKDGYEVFSYPSELDEIEELLPEGDLLMPYGYKSVEAYLEDVDKAMKQYAKSAEEEALFEKYKDLIAKMNDKSKWSVLRYMGPKIGEVGGLTPGKVYFWPCSEERPYYEGVIDDEEFTSYYFPTNEEYWEILEDPTGMAKRTIEGGQGYMSRDSFDSIQAQLENATIIEE